MRWDRPGTAEQGPNEKSSSWETAREMVKEMGMEKETATATESARKVKGIV